MLRVAILTLYPVETASTRQRVHKNIRFFPRDVHVRVFPGITSEAARAAASGGSLGRLAFLLVEVARKLRHLWLARRYDVIVVQKGLTVMNVRGLPALLFALGRPVVFDFDDAVYLEAPQALRWPGLSWLFRGRQVMDMMPRFHSVVAGNRFLAEVARAVNPRVVVIGTPMDTDWYRQRSVRRVAPLVIGWSGSTTTNHYVARLGPILARLAAAGHDFEFRVISNDDRGIDWARLGVARTAFVPWRLESLVNDLLEIDIGVMPLDDDEWSRSKCGGKILQYMACGIPAVASPVGINSAVLEDGVSGFLAANDDAWVSALETLLLDADLRARMGAAARRAVEREHCNRVTSPRLLEVLRGVVTAAG